MDLGTLGAIFRPGAANTHPRCKFMHQAFDTHPSTQLIYEHPPYITHHPANYFRVLILLKGPQEVSFPRGPNW